MPLRWQEVALPLVIITVLIALKYVPAFSQLPLSRAAGVVAFGYAAFLALRLMQPEVALVTEDGWSELRPSLVEYFACYGAAALSMVLLLGVITLGHNADLLEVFATYLAALLLLVGAAGIGLAGLFTNTRWDHRRLVHRSALGRTTTIEWSKVHKVMPNWRGVTVVASTGAITFSQFHAGAAQLVSHAAMRARRNSETATSAFGL